MGVLDLGGGSVQITFHSEVTALDRSLHRAIVRPMSHLQLYGTAVLHDCISCNKLVACNFGVACCDFVTKVTYPIETHLTSGNSDDDILANSLVLHFVP